MKNVHADNVQTVSVRRQSYGLALLFAVAVVTMLSLTPTTASAHCEIPCGIYHDSLRFEMLAEHIQTIEKSMNEIQRLSAEGDKNYNQLVRWVTNKDDHANKFQEIVTQYFMFQRIKPVDPGDAEAFSKYEAKVVTLHQMLVYAMKCKQTVDTANTAMLSDLLSKFHKLYVDEHGHMH